MVNFFIYKETQKPQTARNDGEFAKWQTMEKVTVLLYPDQKECFDRLAKNIMRYRRDTPATQYRERITTNTVIRAVVQNFLEREEFLTEEVLETEEDVVRWVGTLFKGS